ncbi:MAG: NAD(P)H-quinone oxidoreductase, partial [Acidimicrobiia bacterium]|nr:NAD(P)H-quinone oxidoreductase [Acidimicrobiia bacterium]
MRAAVLNSYGEPDVLSVQEVPDPRPGPEEILVDVVTTALNRADLLQRRGMYPGPAMTHEIPGMEFSGRVAAVGSGVTAWSEGDEVMGIVGGGAYAERLVVHERQTLPVPSSIPVADAAAIPEVFLTAFDALVVQGGLTSGRWALVHAGASGVGTAAIQIAKAIGARIAVTASAAKHDRCLALGADRVIDYRTESFADVVSEATGGHGVDVVLDVVGGEYTIDNIKSLRVGGRLIQVGVMGRQTVELPLGMLLPKRASIIGTVLRARPIEEKIALTQRARAELLPLFDQGALAPVIDSRYRLDDIAEAHRYMESK